LDIAGLDRVNVSLQISRCVFVNGEILQMHTIHERNYVVIKLPSNGNNMANCFWFPKKAKGVKKNRFSKSGFKKAKLTTLIASAVCESAVCLHRCFAT